MVGLCEDKFVVFQVDSQNLLGKVNRGSPRLKLNELVRELLWFALKHGITSNVELVPRKGNALADELSKIIIRATRC